MFEIQTKYDIVKVYAETIEEEAVSQIINMANSPLGENAHIRIMPDAHAGAGCTIGTTMLITDKVCPNLVGVDIGCGVDLVQVNGDFEDRLPELDAVIRNCIPSGRAVHKTKHSYDFDNLKCWDKLPKATQDLAFHSLGTLGGGNHFIEAYANGNIAVHSGSRNIGWKVAEYYQKAAVRQRQQVRSLEVKEILENVPPQNREQFLLDYKKEHPSYSEELCYLTDELMEDYLHDMLLLERFAVANRFTILSTICRNMDLKIEDGITSTHNYISEDRILRKGAIAANFNERLVIPMNMRDGILICNGKGNGEWNCSAPHGAGRLYSRSKAKEIFTVEEYANSMSGIYTTCINQSTLDEAPFVYKNWEEIAKAIEPTAEIIKHLKPIYNFKASE